MIKVTNFHGFIIKKDALATKSIDMEKLIEIMESQPMDQDNDLISFGPSFGQEAADSLSIKLEAAGLVYVDDFYIFVGDFPDWISFKALRTQKSS